MWKWLQITKTLCTKFSWWRHDTSALWAIACECIMNYMITLKQWYTCSKVSTYVHKYIIHEVTIDRKRKYVIVWKLKFSKTPNDSPHSSLYIDMIHHSKADNSTVKWFITETWRYPKTDVTRDGDSQSYTCYFCLLVRHTLASFHMIGTLFAVNWFLEDFQNGSFYWCPYDPMALLGLRPHCSFPTSSAVTWA